MSLGVAGRVIGSPGTVIGPIWLLRDSWLLDVLLRPLPAI
jgi:hypothetical protein